MTEDRCRQKVYLNTCKEKSLKWYFGGCVMSYNQSNILEYCIKFLKIDIH